MNRKELRRRLAQRPNAVRFDELRRYLELCGYTVQRVRGSHHIFRFERRGIVIPYRRPHVHTNYVREALAETREEDDDD